MADVRIPICEVTSVTSQPDSSKCFLASRKMLAEAWPDPIDTMRYQSVLLVDLGCIFYSSIDKK